MKSITSKTRRTSTARGLKTLTSIAGALAMLFAAPAYADTITFESVAGVGYDAGESFVESGYRVTMLEGPFGGANGAVMTNGSCAITVCPGGATGKFLGVLNDGGVNFALASHSPLGFKVAGLDFAFLAAVGGLPNFNYGQLQLSGLLADGNVVNASFDFPGQNGSGAYMFGAANLGATFTAGLFRSLTINACIFEDENPEVCSNSIDNPAFYLGQFALDNVQLIAVVPEPVSILLLGVGAGAMALSRRRTIKPAQLTNLQAQGN